MTRRIDLNCDLGEGAGHDADLMPFISSANIACGGHAGDVDTMRRAVALAFQHDVAIGAHPGLSDRAGFGRVEMSVTVADVRDLVMSQTQALQAIARERGARVTHVKPHGALYNMAARDRDLAQAVAEAVRDCDRNLALVGLAGSHLLTEAARIGIRAISEAFADRTYQPDGSLTPRSHPGAVIVDDAAIVAQALGLAIGEAVMTMDGTRLSRKADTLCLHGDGPTVVGSLRLIRAAFDRAGISVAYISTVPVPGAGSLAPGAGSREPAWHREP